MKSKSFVRCGTSVGLAFIISACSADGSNDWEPDARASLDARARTDSGSHAEDGAVGEDDASPMPKSGAELVVPSLAAFPIDANDALARTDQVVQKGSTELQYAHNPNANDVNYDLRNFEAIGYCDYDSGRYDGSYLKPKGNQPSAPSLCEAECGTKHGQNRSPVRINGVGPIKERISVVGGKVWGDQPTSLTWEIMKHGRYFQNELDKNNDPYPAKSSWDGGFFGMYMAAGSWGYIDGMRFYSTMDSIIALNESGSRTSSDNDLFIRNVYSERARDTFITSEQGVRIHVFDTLVLHSYGLIDYRGGPHMPGISMTVQGSIIELKDLPGGFSKKSSDRSHERIWKVDSNTGSLVMDKVIIKLGPTPRSASSYKLPTRDATYSDVRLLWDSDKAYPSEHTVPKGVTLVNADGNDRAAVQAEFDAAVSNWKSRHGFTDFDNVNMKKMVDPDALYWPITSR